MKQTFLATLETILVPVTPKLHFWQKCLLLTVRDYKLIALISRINFLNHQQVIFEPNQYRHVMTLLTWY